MDQYKSSSLESLHKGEGESQTDRHKWTNGWHQGQEKPICVHGVVCTRMHVWAGLCVCVCVFLCTKMRVHEVDQNAVDDEGLFFLTSGSCIIKGVKQTQQRSLRNNMQSQVCTGLASNKHWAHSWHTAGSYWPFYTHFSGLWPDPKLGVL